MSLAYSAANADAFHLPAFSRGPAAKEGSAMIIQEQGDQLILIRQKRTSSLPGFTRSRETKPPH